MFDLLLNLLIQWLRFALRSIRSVGHGFVAVSADATPHGNCAASSKRWIRIDGKLHSRPKLPREPDRSQTRELPQKSSFPPTAIWIGDHKTERIAKSLNGPHGDPRCAEVFLRRLGLLMAFPDTPLRKASCDYLSKFNIFLRCWTLQLI